MQNLYNRPILGKVFGRVLLRALGAEDRAARFLFTPEELARSQRDDVRGARRGRPRREILLTRSSTSDGSRARRGLRSPTHQGGWHEDRGRSARSLSRARAAPARRARARARRARPRQGPAPGARGHQRVAARGLLRGDRRLAQGRPARRRGRRPHRSRRARGARAPRRQTRSLPAADRRRARPGRGHQAAAADHREGRRARRRGQPAAERCPRGAHAREPGAVALARDAVLARRRVPHRRPRLRVRDARRRYRRAGAVRAQAQAGRVLRAPRGLPRRDRRADLEARPDRAPDPRHPRRRHPERRLRFSRTSSSARPRSCTRS